MRQWSPFINNSYNRVVSIHVEPVQPIQLIVFVALVYNLLEMSAIEGTYSYDTKVLELVVLVWMLCEILTIGNREGTLIVSNAVASNHRAERFSDSVLRPYPSRNESHEMIFCMYQTA